MKRIVLSLLVLAAGLSVSVPAAEPAAGSTADYDARMAWWRDARFGMFIHWGLYSEAAGHWDGKSTQDTGFSDGAGEWIMNDMGIPRSQYATLAPRFDPMKFDADTWVKLAKRAGMKYLVITSKHHEGFCMFRTTATDYNVVDATPWHQDPLLAISKACRRYGVKFCVYYSIMDWHSPDQVPANPDPEHLTYNPTSFAPGKKAAYIAYMETELKELITQYHPALIWFDGQWMNGWTDQDGQALYGYLRSLDPNLIINDRVKGAGDYETPEQHIPPNGLPGHNWETCMTMNHTWGYKENDHDWKSTETLIRNLIDCASKGGNYLLNVGPTGQGIIPEASVERLDQIGKWMQVNGQAIYGTTASPFTRQLPWGRCTSKTTPRGTTLYLHVWDWPANGRLLVPGLQNKISRAYLLKEDFWGWRKRLAAVNGPDGVVVSVPSSAPDRISSTIVLQFPGKSDIAVTPILQSYDGAILLPASDANLHGSTIQYEVGDGHDNIGYWTDPDDWADWKFKVDRPGKFNVSALIAAPAQTSFTLTIAGQSLRAAAPVTDNYTTFKLVPVGVINISQSGTMTLAVRANKDGWNPMNLKSLRLDPVSQAANAQ